MAEKKMGRPTLYRDEYAEQAYKYCLLGADNQKLAALFGVSDTTIDNWIRDKQDFFGAVKRGREIADAEVANSLYHRAIGYSHPAVKIFNNNGAIITADYVEHYPPDTGAAMAWLKNRQPDSWRDTKVLQGDPDKPLAPTINVTTK